MEWQLSCLSTALVPQRLCVESRSGLGYFAGFNFTVARVVCLTSTINHIFLRSSNTRYCIYSLVLQKQYVVSYTGKLDSFVGTSENESVMERVFFIFRSGSWFKNKHQAEIDEQTIKTQKRAERRISCQKTNESRKSNLLSSVAQQMFFAFLPGPGWSPLLPAFSQFCSFSVLYGLATKQEGEVRN